MTTLRKYQRALDSLPANTVKIFDIVPISEAWHEVRIIQEMSRVGMRMDLNILQGCLAKLEEVGLVKRPAFRMWQRTPVPPTYAEIENEPTEEAVELPKEVLTLRKDPLARLEDVLKQMRNHANVIIESAQSIKDHTADIETISLELAAGDNEKIKALEAEVEEFRKLKALLKHMGAG